MRPVKAAMFIRFVIGKLDADSGRLQGLLHRRATACEGSGDPATPAAPATFDEFLKTDVGAGTIREALAFPGARSPADILIIDFGPAIGVRKSVAQITERDALADLPGRRVMRGGQLFAAPDRVDAVGGAGARFRR